MFEAVEKSCRASQALFHALKESKGASVDEQQNRQLIQSSAKAVALAVSEIVGASANLIPSGYVDMSDPNVVAERELLQAASMIEGAAKKLAAFKPVERPTKTVEDMDFEGQILEAAKAIAAATSALVRSATTVQREIISKAGPLSNREDMYYNDGTWYLQSLQKFNT